MSFLARLFASKKAQTPDDDGPSLRSPDMLASNLCTQAQLQSPSFQAWGARLHEKPMHMHRKVWEYCYVAQALAERDLLRPGSRGMGFAVGQEPLSALFASQGCEILATDLATEDAHKDGWVETGQHADSLEALNKRGLCEPDQFRERVRFRHVDMRDLPPAAEIGALDFIWSCCSFEHLGTLELGEKFVYESLRYLRPGGVAVHTTEYNVYSNTETVTSGVAVIYRRSDIERIVRRLREAGHGICLDLTDGNMPLDQVVDEPPFKHETHLKLRLSDYVVTSVGLIIRKA